MNQEYGEFVGVQDIHAALITEDSATAYAAEKPEYLAPAAEITGEPETESQTTHYDNVPQDTYISEGATPLEITVSGIPARKAAKYLGKHYDPASGRVLDTGEPKPPDFALSFIFNKGKDDARYYQYLKGKFSGGAEEAATKEGNTIDIRTYQMTFTAVTTNHRWMIDGKLKPLKRIYGETNEPAFNPDSWFDQVQTPDTTTVPDVFALSSSDPEDGATEIVVGVEPKLTFNNRIKSFDITLVDTVTLVAVECAIALDVTGKILTVSPTVALEAATKYALVVSRVTDVYGQSLTGTVIDFTTA